MTNHEITETSTAHTHTFKHKFTLTATTEATEQKARSALQLHQPKSHRNKKSASPKQQQKQLITWPKSEIRNHSRLRNSCDKHHTHTCTCALADTSQCNRSWITSRLLWVRCLAGSARQCGCLRSIHLAAAAAAATNNRFLGMFS